MPMTTFLNPAENLHPTTSDDVNSCLISLREETGKDWRIQELIYRRHYLGGLIKRGYYSRFELYSHVGGIEYQVINFSGEGRCSICTIVDKHTIVNYITGILAGTRFAKRTLAEAGALPGIDSGHTLPRIVGYLQKTMKSEDKVAS